MRLVRSSRQKGFSLIEIMISVTLLAIGLLAIGGGELTVLQSNRVTTDTMKATAAAEYIIELMRRNGDNLPSYAGVNTNNPAFATPRSMMQFDFNNWKTQITDSVRGIPAPVFGTVAVVSGGQLGASKITTVGVSILWPSGPAINPATPFFSAENPNGIIFSTNIAS